MNFGTGKGTLYFGGKTYAAALSAPAEWVCTREAFHRFQYFEWSAGGAGTCEPARSGSPCWGVQCHVPLIC